MTLCGEPTVHAMQTGYWGTWFTHRAEILIAIQALFFYVALNNVVTELMRWNCLLLVLSHV
jgi:hypothetical protein